MHYVTKEDIVAIREKMGLTKNQFAYLMNIKSGANVTAWETGRCKPTGPRYKRLLELKGKFLHNSYRNMTPEKAAAQITTNSTPAIESAKLTEEQVMSYIINNYRSMSVGAQETLRYIVDCMVI